MSISFYAPHAYLILPHLLHIYIPHAYLMPTSFFLVSISSYLILPHLSSYLYNSISFVLTSTSQDAGAGASRLALVTMLRHRHGGLVGAFFETLAFMLDVEVHPTLLRVRVKVGVFERRRAKSRTR